MPVNINDQTQTGDDSTFVWLCGNCHYEEWTNETHRGIIKKSAKENDLAGKQPNPEIGGMKIEKLSEKYDTPKCPNCGEKSDMGVVADKLTIWVCSSCDFKSGIMQIPLSRWIEKLERGNKGVINGL